MTKLRLHRQTELPAEFNEKSYREASGLPTIWIGSGDITVEYAVSAPYFVDGEVDVPLDETTYHLRRQVCRAWVRHDGRSVGGVNLSRFTIPTFMTNEEFLDVMDRESSETHRLSCALAHEFDSVSEEVGDYGDIIELNRVWLSPVPEVAGASGEILESLIAAVFPDFSLIVLKAYPLEYEGNLPDGSPMRPAFERRQAALMRLYGKTLGVTRMSGRYGDEGWMCRFKKF
ncbi:hypothetical protein [Maricaulis parjimensis]|uniref:hypothetical protein n=1 Tax=Maricaulis parjimensis TaxID=144023 RepID=UPI00193A1B96|nr:hypothetical protein [Maricaulis parjimensis]